MPQLCKCLRVLTHVFHDRVWARKRARQGSDCTSASPLRREQNGKGGTKPVEQASIHDSGSIPELGQPRTHSAKGNGAESLQHMRHALRHLSYAVPAASARAPQEQVCIPSAPACAQARQHGHDARGERRTRPESEQGRSPARWTENSV